MSSEGCVPIGWTRSPVRVNIQRILKYIMLFIILIKSAVESTIHFKKFILHISVFSPVVLNDLK